MLQTRPNVVPLHAWTLVAVVWDAGSGERRIYVNGRLVSRRLDAPTRIARSRADLGIGAHLHSPSNQGHAFIGRMDEVGLYGVALTDEKIARLYSARAEARWPAEGNALDATRSGHDGVAVGDVSFAPGIVGQGFAFSGESYVEIDPRIGNYGPEDFSVELWLRSESDADILPRVVLAKRRAGANALNLSLDDGRVVAMLASRSDSLHLGGGSQVSPTWSG